MSQRLGGWIRGSMWLAAWLVTIGVGRDVAASPSRTAESAYGGWRLLEYDPLRNRDPLELQSGFEVEALKEQMLEWIPDGTLETVARTLTDRTVQLRLSSEQAVVLVKLPL